ncbi:hypothetical protein Trydic_g18233 [Trypoxylus dichotomus]
MQEDNSLAEKILTELESIIYIDDNLTQFDIIPVLENNTNRSPVLYEEHSLGLEMWCVKHVYAHIHSYLLNIRKKLKLHLSHSDIRRINKLLLGGVLLQPDVSTFWNMRRDLIEMNLITMDKELLITKLVLSYKFKSNEAFSHRKWVVKRILKNVPAWNTDDIIRLIAQELLVAKMACQKENNNYHAWTYKLWWIENVSDLTLKSTIAKRELDSSLTMVFFNVSAHSGFHYRQRLLLVVHACVPENDSYFKRFKQFLLNYLHFTNDSIDLLLPFLLEDTIPKSPNDYLNLFSLLLFDLLHTCCEINKHYPGHEAVWYHRRFLVHTLLETLYKAFNLDWVRDVKIADEGLDESTNIVNVPSGMLPDKLQENGEKYPKLFKAGRRIVEDTFLYKLILKTETDFVSNGILHSNPVQCELAQRHTKWLKNLMKIEIC